MKPIQNLPDIIFLCGFMGAGESTVGRALASRLELAFADLDSVIEEAAGRNIPDIFEEEGEEYFRKLEREQLLKAIRSYKGVLALGGGTLQNQHIVDHVKINGLLVFIETPFSVIFERITGQEGRPLLMDEHGTLKEKDRLQNELKALYNKRLPRYRQAELTINTEDHSTVEETVAALARKIDHHVSHY